MREPSTKRTPLRVRWSAMRAVGRLRAALYWEARGDLEEAAAQADHAERLLAGRGAPCGSRDGRLARTHIALADLHRRAGRYPEAVAALTTAGEGFGDAPAIVMLLGVIAKEQGRFDEAAGHYATLARIGLSRNDAAALQHNLAGLANARRDFETAERYARQSVRLRQADPRATAVDVAKELAVLAASLAGQRRYAEARNLFGETLAVYRAARPIREYEVAVQLHNLAAIHQDCGQVADGERLYREALAIKQRLLGAAHPEVALVAHNLATLLREVGRTDEAAAYFAQALTTAENALPADHPLVAAVRANASLPAQPDRRPDRLDGGPEFGPLPTRAASRRRRP